MEQFDEWSYADWNDRLIEHHFVVTSVREVGNPVYRLAATPEELLLVAGNPPVEPSKVANAFLQRVVGELPVGRISFCAYCLKHQRDRVADESARPHFFAMLWFTCLVAHGYPGGAGAFADRLAGILGKYDNFQYGKDQQACLPKLWRDFAAWTKARNAAGESIRILQLPPDSPRLPVIGYSYFLAFPNRQDRQRLRTLLDKENLLGSEPPIGPIIGVLLRAKQDFSSEFQVELDTFVNQFLKGGQDPRESPFWRAVRQEVYAPGQERAAGTVERAGQTTLMAHFDEDELLELYIACTEQYPAPPGFTREPLDVMEGEFRYRLEPEASSSSHPAFEKFLTGTARRAYVHGLVPLLKVATGEYRLAQGEEVAGCELALVRDDRVEPFVRTFGGKKMESALDGWREIGHCQLRQLDVLPQGLAGVTTLLHTTEPQKPHLVGGLRTSTGAYYRLQGYLPRIHAPGAEKVELRVADAWVPCVSSDTGQPQAPEWLIPEKIGLDALDELRVAATWKVHIENYPMERRGETRASLASWNISVDYKGLPSGSFWLETTSRRMFLLQGPAAEVALGFTTTNPGGAMDMLFFDATTRWLGPGVGEMSLSPREGFPWLAFGPKNAPHLVLFVGDVARPVPADGGASPDRADRRHWKRAFLRGRPTFVRRGSEYVSLSEFPEVQAIHSTYVDAATRSKISDDSRPCAPTHLDSFIDDDAAAADEYSVEAKLLVDVLSILVQNRSGIPLREVHEHLSRLTGTDEHHSLRYHLIRALAEVGAIDMLLRVDGRQTVVVARRPRLVIFRRGNRFRATVMGLLPSTTIQTHLQEWKSRLEITFGVPPNRFQPPVVRVEAKEGTLEPLEAFSRALAFAPYEFLHWPDTAHIPEHFAVRDELERSMPPENYEREATWCWKTGAFVRTPEDRGAVSIEVRKHDKRAPIYVVMRAEAVQGWSHSRAWALLDASERAGRPPFVLDGEGLLRTAANAPMHLPLPLARLCTVVGVGVPGPCVELRQGRPEVIAYTYPFGKRLVPLIARAVPESWTQRKVE